jgi:hypothetical protein
MFNEFQKDLRKLYNDPCKFVEKSENGIPWNFQPHFLLTKA